MIIVKKGRTALVETGNKKTMTVTNGICLASKPTPYELIHLSRPHDFSLWSKFSIKTI
jgi:hypothetical protein